MTACSETTRNSVICVSCIYVLAFMLAFLSTDTAFHVLDQWFLNWGRPPPMEGVKGSQGGREYMAATYCWKAGQWQIIVDLLFVFDLEVN